MSGILSALIIIFILGVLIVAHELGHFFAARKCGVRVLEFAIGMGPVIYKRQKSEDGTKFTLRLFPIGGFCAMEGEDTASDDPSAFPNASKGRRLIILLAGSAMNLLLGLVLAFVLVAPVKEMVVPVISDISPQSSMAGENGVKAGDTILKVNGHAIYRFADVSLFLEIGKGHPYDIDVRRGGEVIKLRGMDIEKREIDGVVRYGFAGTVITPTLADKVALGFYTALDYCRLVWVSLIEILSGNVGADALTGPVGMGGIVNDVVTVPNITLLDRVWALLDMMILITLNLGIFNLLPLPALDGGRIIFILIEAVRGRPVPPKYEGVIHGAGMLAFFALMIFVFYNDIVRLVGLS